MAQPRSSTTSVQRVTPVPGLFTATPARLASMLGPRPQGPMHGRARSFTSKPCSSFRALNRRSVSRDPSSRQSRPVHTYISTGGASLVVDGVDGCGCTGSCCCSADTDAIPSAKKCRMVAMLSRLAGGHEFCFRSASHRWKSNSCRQSVMQGYTNRLSFANLERPAARTGPRR